MKCVVCSESTSGYICKECSIWAHAISHGKSRTARKIVVNRRLAGVFVFLGRQMDKLNELIKKGGAK